MGCKVGADLRADRAYFLRRAGDVPPYHGIFRFMDSARSLHRLDFLFHVERMGWRSILFHVEHAAVEILILCSKDRRL